MDIVFEFGIPANTLNTILKNIEIVLQILEDNSIRPSRKQLKLSIYPDLKKSIV